MAKTNDKKDKINKTSKTNGTKIATENSKEVDDKNKENKGSETNNTDPTDPKTSNSNPNDSNNDDNNETSTKKGYTTPELWKETENIPKLIYKGFLKKNKINPNKKIAIDELEKQYQEYKETPVFKG